MTDSLCSGLVPTFGSRVSLAFEGCKKFQSTELLLELVGATEYLALGVGGFGRFGGVACAAPVIVAQ